MSLRLLASLAPSALIVACFTACGGDDNQPAASTPAATNDAGESPLVLNPLDICGKPEQEPKQMVFTCADYGRRIEGLRWQDWGDRTATAEGVFNVQGCDPDCASDNRTHSYAVKVSAHLPTECPGGSRQYAFVRYEVTSDVFDENRPDDGALGFDCPGDEPR